MKTSLCLALFIAAAVSAQAKLITRTIDYEHDGVKLEGYLAYDDALSAGDAGRAGVVIAPEWWGLTDYARGRADQLAGLGYVAFAIDMYGKGVVTTDAQTAGQLAAPFYSSPLMAARARAGLNQLLQTGLVDRSRVAAIGYCFGGSAVLALAFSGAPLAAVVTFHGGLVPVPPDAATRTKARFLICHGALDPLVKKAQVDAFLKSMNEQKFDYQFIAYSGAKHAFTNPDADELAKSNHLEGIGYNAAADHRSWDAMKAFLREVFSQPPSFLGDAPGF